MSSVWWVWVVPFLPLNSHLILEIRVYECSIHNSSYFKSAISLIYLFFFYFLPKNRNLSNVSAYVVCCNRHCHCFTIFPPFKCHSLLIHFCGLIVLLLFQFGATNSTFMHFNASTCIQIISIIAEIVSTAFLLRGSVMTDEMHACWSVWEYVYI